MQKRLVKLSPNIPQVVPIGGKQWKIGTRSSKTAVVDVEFFNEIGATIATWKAVEKRAVYRPPNGFSKLMFTANEAVDIEYYITDGSGTFEIDVDITGQTVLVETAPGKSLDVTIDSGQITQLTDATAAAGQQVTDATTAAGNTAAAASTAAGNQVSTAIAETNSKLDTSNTQLAAIATLLDQPNGCLEAFHVEVCPPTAQLAWSQNNYQAVNNTDPLLSFNPARQRVIIRNVSYEGQLLALGGAAMDDTNSAIVLAFGETWESQNQAQAMQEMYMRAVPDLWNPNGMPWGQNGNKEAFLNVSELS